MDGSGWTPTLAFLVKNNQPFILTMYDATEGEKTTLMLQQCIDHPAHIGKVLLLLLCCTRTTHPPTPLCPFTHPPTHPFPEWGPELNPVRSLVLEDAEPPESRRYASLCMDGLVKAGEEIPDGLELPPLDLAACNHTSGNSRYWTGVCGPMREEGEEKEEG